MDFSVIFQLRTKRFWWMEVIFYFVISLFVATVLCYFIFLIKDGIQRKEIQDETVKLQNEGTDSQRQEEAQVINYQKKISAFTGLFQNHEFASNVFAFLQTETMPDVWFKQFTLDRKSSSVQLSGEAEDMDGLSRQVADFEKNEYVKSVGSINSSLGDSARVEFSFNLVLDPKIFNYTSVLTPIIETTTASNQSPINNLAGQVKSQNLITSFHLLINPEVIGVIDQTNYVINLNVPYGTDVKSLMPSIVFSPGARVFPASGTIEDFTNPVVYTVIGQDGSSQSYKVSVSVLPKVSPAASKAKSNMLVIVLMVVFIFIAVAFVAGFFIWRKMKSKKSNI